MNLIEERTIALAGVIQASQQVQSLARNGHTSTFDAEPLLDSILILDAVSSPAVYGGVANLASGLDKLQNGLLVTTHGDDIEILRYCMGLLHLQTQLYKDRAHFEAFSLAVERLSGVDKSQFQQYCSDVYQEFISQLRPQIIVQGEESFLQRDDVPPQIRTMLLAGIRSAVLWQQKGGSKFKLLWQRTRMQNAAKSLLATISVH